MMTVVLLICILLLVPNGRAITFCVIPNTTVCSIDYPVPASIALIAGVLESEIQSAFNSDMSGGNSAPCSQSLKEVRCAQSFPRCSNDSTSVTVTSLDCKQRLTCATTNTVNRLNAQGFCNLMEKTVPLDGCKPVSGYGYTFKMCTTYNDLSITDWMFALLQYEDTYLSSDSVLGAAGFLAMNYPSCSPGYAQYYCSLVGQCDPSGALGVNYTRPQCQQVLNCYPSGSTSSSLNLYCDYWPNTTTFYTVSKAPINGTGNSNSSAMTGSLPTSASATPPPYSSSTSTSGGAPTTNSIGLFTILLVYVLLPHRYHN